MTPYDIIWGLIEHGFKLLANLQAGDPSPNAVRAECDIRLESLKRKYLAPIADEQAALDAAVPPK